MSKQAEMINKMCTDAEYFMVQFQSKDKEDFGKILTTEEMINLDLSKHEIYRSIEYKDGNKLFVFDLLPLSPESIDNPLELLLKNREQAKAIELVYPEIFTWIFNGLSIKAYAIVPSGDIKANTTIGRYGSTDSFIRILRQHLRNISKMRMGKTPDYHFLNNIEKIDNVELSLGSINDFNKMYSVSITLDTPYLGIIENSEKNIQTSIELNTLDMKFWAREINPDILYEAKPIKLNKVLSLEGSYNLYPQAIKNIMGLRKIQNYERWLLARFLLSVHHPRDAKFVFFSVLGPEMGEHTKAEGQWTFIKTNMKEYGCPTKRELKRFWPTNDNLTHPLELIQAYLETKKEK